MEATTWKAASAYVIGRSHEKDATVCQDRTFTLSDQGIQVIALADGAGSAVLSHYGAELVVKQVSHYIIKHFDELMAKDHATVAEELLAYLLNELEEESRIHPCEISDLASTLLFAAASDHQYIVGHLGDGMITGLTPDGLQIISHPENGEYANATYFITSKDASSHLRVVTGDLNQLTAFHLMSDGTTSSMYRKSDHALSPALSTMSGWLLEHDEATVSEALEQNLFKSIRMKTFDDCSFALMVRQQATQAKEG